MQRPANRANLRRIHWEAGTRKPCALGGRAHARLSPYLREGPKPSRTLESSPGVDWAIAMTQKSAASPVAVVVSTHTPRHLAWVLSGLAAQTRVPDAVVVTCDVVDPAITAITARAPLPVLLVERPHTGKSRSSQVRNNGVRALMELGVKSECTLVFLDGDCVPNPDTVAHHARLCGSPSPGGRLVIGFRHDLDENQTAALGGRAGADAERVLTPGQTLALDRRISRYRRQSMLRRFGLAKAHKPKLLSANFSVALSDYLSINGFDERYEGYGQEDDDLGRRLYRIGCQPVIGIRETVVYHQYHPTRAPGQWADSPNARLFAAGGPARCEHGISNPVPQPPVQVTSFNGSSAGQNPQ